MKFSFLLSCLLVLASCGVKESALDDVKKRASAEEEANSKVQRQNQTTKAANMETDLTARHAYYRAFSGRFEGELTTARGIYKVSFDVFPTIPPYRGQRERQLSEIESDMAGLKLFILVRRWQPGVQGTVHCRITGIAPDTYSGELFIGATDCPNIYQIFLADEASAPARINREKMSIDNYEELVGRSTEINSALNRQELKKVMRFVGSDTPSTIVEVNSLDMRRVQ